MSMPHVIDGRELIESDRGSKVTYIPPHANKDASHPDSQGGTISSWNNYYIFVNFGTGTPAACSPEHLVWG